MIHTFKQLLFGFSWSASLETREEEYHHIYESVLKPLIRGFYQLPDLLFVFYFSGTVLHWLSRTHTEAIGVLEEMVKRQQAEALGGAFYEPFVTHIPAIDYMRQIELLSDNIRKLFGKRPQGFWVPAHIWSPQLVPLLAKSGISYTFLNPSDNGSMAHRTVYLPSITEYDGRALTLFLLSAHWSQQLFRRNLEEFMRELQSSEISGGISTVIFPLSALKVDSSEDLQRWLELFLQTREGLRLNLPRTAYKTLARVIKAHPPSSECIHLPMPRHSHQRAPIRSLLKKLPETGKIYEKMYHTHTLIQQFRGDKARKKSAKMNLWKGQSHFVYWGGFYTGVQSPALRQAHYSAFIEAEKTIRQKGGFFPTLAQLDYDFDGFLETLFYGNNINVYIHHVGASIFELDWLHGSWNYGNTYTRKEDHLPLKENQLPTFDRYSRYSFVDLCLVPGQSIMDFAQLNYEESGNFREQRYTVTQFDRQKKTLAFHCRQAMHDGTELMMEKRYRFLNNGFTLGYTISLVDQKGIFHMDFCPDIALSFADIQSFRTFSKETEVATDVPVEVSQCQELKIKDLHRHSVITLSFSQAYNLWSVPVYGWGYHRGEVKRLYQFSSFVPVWPVRIEGSKSFHCTVKMLFERFPATTAGGAVNPASPSELQQ